VLTNVLFQESGLLIFVWPRLDEPQKFQCVWPVHIFHPTWPAWKVGDALFLYLMASGNPLVGPGQKYVLE